MKKKTIALVGAALLAGCATNGNQPASVERMHVIQCGENDVKDLSRWTPGVNVGKAHVFNDHCNLIRHAQGWITHDKEQHAAIPKAPGWVE